MGVEGPTSYGCEGLTNWYGSGTAAQTAAVARPVPMKETLWNDQARAAMDKEWNRMKSIKTWMEDTVISAREAERKAKEQGTTYHFGPRSACSTETKHFSQKRMHVLQK